MCGIAGLFGTTAEKRLSLMLQQQVHRGPDSEGRRDLEGVSLGMRRLSIIDLEGGDQPCLDQSGAISVFMNGEIYNHKELRQRYPQLAYASQTDTEVVPHLYALRQEEALHELRGMFALAIHDADRQQVTLVRDRLGIKPLWIYQTPDVIAWSSEIKSFAAAGLRLSRDPQALWDYLTHGYIPAPRSPFLEVTLLEPGHLARLDLKTARLEKKCWWHLPEEDWADPAPATAVAKVREICESSIREHLVSDVPLGCLLSGGLDSGLLTAWSSKILGSPVRTYSVGFAESSYDERAQARRLADLLGCEHTAVELRCDDFLKTLDVAMCRSDTLLADPAMVALVPLYDRLSQDITVVLDGDGADEVFAGYPTVTADRLHMLTSKLPMVLRQALNQLAKNLPESRRKLGLFSRLERLWRNASLDPVTAHCLWRNIHRLESRQRLVRPEWHPQTPEGLLGVENYVRHAKTRTGSFREFSKIDLNVWLPDDNLKKVDGQSMGVSVEARVPFLDHRLVETVYPWSMGLKRRFGVKGLMREAARGILPDPFLNTPKAGFHLPLERWLGQAHAQGVQERLNAFSEVSGDFLNPDAVRTFISHPRVNSYEIFNLLALASWWTQWPTQKNLST